MTTICWTIIHHAAVPANHVAHRIAGAVVRRAVHAAHHVAVAAAQPRVWIELVCKTLPAAVAGAGLLAPHPANPPQIPGSPPAIMEPAPPIWPWHPPGWIAPPGLPAEPYGGPAPSPNRTPEPCSAGLLLIGIGGIALIRLGRRHGSGLTHGLQPPLREADLVGGGPVARPLVYIHQDPVASGQDQRLRQPEPVAIDAERGGYSGLRDSRREAPVAERQIRRSDVGKVAAPVHLMAEQDDIDRFRTEPRGQGADRRQFLETARAPGGP